MTSLRTLAGLALSLALSLAAAASAQVAPGDIGASGEQRGIQEQNNSGEVGSVTLSRAGDNATRLVVELRGMPGGRNQQAFIHRGKSCDEVDRKPAFSLKPVSTRDASTVGRSNSVVKYPIERLLSGNYVVVIRGSNTDATHYVACGELYG